MSSETLTLHEAAEMLGVHYMTAYRYVRIGKLPASKEGGVWVVAKDDVDALMASPRPMAGRGSAAAPWHERFEDRVLAGDESGAWMVVEAALASGHDPRRLYLEVLAPTLRRIGDRWKAGEIDIAEEHRATTIAGRLMGRLSPRFVTRGRKRGTVIIGGAPGDLHGLGGSMLADLLRMERFEVFDLGADVPAESFVYAARAADDLVAVGISAFTSDNDDSIREAISAVKRVSDAPVLLGGPAIDGEAHAEALGADGYAAGGRAAVDLISALVV